MAKKIKNQPRNKKELLKALIERVNEERASITPPGDEVPEVITEKEAPTVGDAIGLLAMDPPFALMAVFEVFGIKLDFADLKNISFES